MKTGNFLLLGLLAVFCCSCLAAVPAGFFWGTATAAYQIEGAWDQDNRGLCIWDVFTHIPGHIANFDNGDVSDNSYNLYKTDIALLKELGVNTYRFSIGWSRILPNGRLPVNELAVKHYSDIIDGLIAAGITPLVTLYHWDLPLSLDWNSNGWLNETIIQSYSLYADTIFERFGDRVKHFITFNEPLEFCWQGYGTGGQAPGRCSNRTLCPFGDSATEPYVCAHNVLLSHAEAVKIFRTKYKAQQGKIGITLDCTYGEPLTSDFGDKAARERYLEFQLSWFADPVFFGDYPQSMKTRVGSRLPRFTEEQKNLLKGSHDFFGLNHYTTRYVSEPSVPPTQKGWQWDQDTDASIYDAQGKVIGPRADSSWLYVVPWGFRGMLNWVKQRYGAETPIIVTENGVDVPGENAMPIDQAINDTFRVDFLTNYTSELLKAIEVDKVNVIGYMVWSLLDNFEWADGYSKRFGIHYVDYSSPDLKRYINKSSMWYKQFIKNQQSQSELSGVIEA